MPEFKRYGLFVIYAFIRRRQFTDNLVELLIRITHKIVKSGESKIKKMLSQVVEIKKSCNTKEMLHRLAVTILSNKESLVKDAIFPVISEEELEQIKSLQSGGGASYNYLVHDSARGGYIGHYRRLLAPVLELLTFDTNNEAYQPIIEALNLIKSELESSKSYYPESEDVPLSGALSPSHEEFVIDISSDKKIRVKRLDYELSVLRFLRDRLRTKEVWVSNAYQYRNPEKDLPQDFKEKRAYYYNLLNKPMSAKKFTRDLKHTLTKHLEEFNKQLPYNKSVKVLLKPKGHIKLSKLEKQPVTPQLYVIKSEIFKRWPSTSLLDVLKETDLFVEFIKGFIASGPKEGLNKDILRKRLLLVILGYGTNAGLKGISKGNEYVTYQDLKHVKLRYLDPDNLRNAIRAVVNQKF